VVNIPTHDEVDRIIPPQYYKTPNINQMVSIVHRMIKSYKPSMDMSMLLVMLLLHQCLVEVVVLICHLHQVRVIAVEVWYNLPHREEVIHTRLLQIHMRHHQDQSRCSSIYLFHLHLNLSLNVNEKKETLRTIVFSLHSSYHECNQQSSLKVESIASHH